MGSVSISIILSFLCVSLSLQSVIYIIYYKWLDLKSPYARINKIESANFAMHPIYNLQEH